MRVLVCTLPGVSHFFPMVPVLRALARREHQVLVVSAPSFAPWIHACGFPAAPAGHDYRVGQEVSLSPALREARLRGDSSFRYSSIVLVETLARRMLPDLQSLVHHWRPDVIVRDPVEFASLVAAKARGLPHVSGRENRFLPEDIWRSEIGDALQALADAAGWRTTDPVGCLYEHLGLASAFPEFISAVGALPHPREFGNAVARRMRFFAHELPGPVTTAGDGQEPWQRRGPLVLASLGTVFNESTVLPNSLLDAVRGAPFRLLLLTGPGHAGGYRESANVSIAEFVALEEVLGQCAAVVTTGGLGTVMAALTHGLPLVVVPVNADQPTNAARCAALGAGIDLGRSPSVASLREALDSLLLERSFLQAAQRCAACLHALPGSEAAAQAVEQVVSSRTPA